MSLNKLSDGLLLEIAGWAGTDAYYPSLTKTITAVRGTRFLGPLAVCSRRLNTIVSPLLYRTFTQTNTKALPAFLRLVLESPRLAKRSRNLWLQNFLKMSSSACLDGLHIILDGVGLQ
jgi:hypothetical protein